MASWVGREHKSLRVTDYFERRWNGILRRPVWAVRNRRAIAIPATVTSLVALRGALVRIYAFHGYDLDQYVYATEPPCDEPACRAELAAGGDAAVAAALRVYWVAAHVAVIGGLSFDLARLLGATTSLGDLALAFVGAANERRRKLRLLVFAVPLLHLCYLFRRPLAVSPCCVATPAFAALKERAQEMAFLTVVSAFALVGQAQHHGYFFLRVPPLDNYALFLVRDHLVRCEDKRRGGKEHLHRASQFLMALGQGGGGSMKPHHSDSDDDASGSDSDDDAAPTPPRTRPPPPPGPSPRSRPAPPAPSPRRRSPKARLHEQHPPAY